MTGVPLDSQLNPDFNQKRQEPRARALHDMNQSTIQ